MRAQMIKRLKTKLVDGWSAASWVTCLLLGWILLQAILNWLLFHSDRYHLAAYQPLMTIDGQTYFKLARRMVQRNDFIFTDTTKFSSLMQIIMAQWVRITGNQEALVFQLQKMFSFFLWLGILTLCFRIGRHIGLSFKKSLFVVAWVSTSNLLHVYCAVTQYEIIAAFLFTFLLDLGLRDPKKRPAGSGAVAFLLAITRVHFLTSFFWVGFAGLFSKKPRSGWLKSALVLASLVVVWSVYFSLRSQRLIFIQDGQGFNFSLHRDAAPTNYPLNLQIAGTNGFPFIFNEPIEYLKLLGRRLPYSCEILPDSWFQPSVIEQAILWFHWFPEEPLRWLIVTLEIAYPIGSVLRGSHVDRH